MESGIKRKSLKIKMMSSMSISLITIAINIANIHGKPDGAPIDACDSMVPGHGVDAQPGTSNYNISLSSENYACGNNITVTLTGSSAFKGFLCQARTSVNNGTTRAGTFDIGERTDVQRQCNNQGVTHTSRSNKTSMEFTWKHAENIGNVYIVCTWVQSKSMFWTKEQSEMLSYQDGNCDGEGVGTTTSGAATGTTTAGAGTGTTTAGVGTETTTAGVGTETTTTGAGTRNGNAAGPLAAFLIFSYIITI